MRVAVYTRWHVVARFTDEGLMKGVTRRRP